MPVTSPPITTILSPFGQGLGIKIQKVGELSAKRIPRGHYIVQPNDNGTITVTSIYGLGNFLIYNEDPTTFSDGTNLDENDDPIAFADQGAMVTFLETYLF